MTIAVLGAGRMGEALARGWLRAPALGFRGSDLRLLGRDDTKTSRLAESLGDGVLGTNRPADAVRDADVLVLCVKPHLVESVLFTVKPHARPDSLLLSVAAGVRLATLEASFHPGAAVLRAMPNTPAQIGASASAFCRGTHAIDNDAATVHTLLAAVGVAVEVTEAQLDAVIGVAGSAVAYYYLFIEALTDGGVRAGLPRAVARELAAQTAVGAGRMVLETGEHPMALKDAVTTPGGTTIAALATLEKNAVRGAVIEAVEAAANRAREMG